MTSRSSDRNATPERVQELLEANNRYLERARDAEALNAELFVALRGLGPIIKEIHAKWDEGMRAGKLLIALMDPSLRYRRDVSAIHAAVAKAESAIPDPGTTYQARVHEWMLACFGETVSADIVERCDRFIEEALELAQSMGWTADRAHALVDYVFGRPIGEPFQEVGGVMVTLAALCNSAGVDLDNAAETELARVWTKIDKIRAKQAAKPTGSALPIAVSRAPVEQPVERGEPS